MEARGGPRPAPGTLTKLFFDSVSKFNRPDALQVKVAGAYKPISHTEVAERRQDAAARQQERPPVGVDIAVPPGGGVGHLTSSAMRKGLANPAELSMVRPEITGSGPENQKGIASVKVIASSLRKGNVLDIDGKLYVVMNAESFHPGKGTPTTQVDMRRISDGVKVQDGAHDLIVGPSSVTCEPGLSSKEHQDGVQVQGGSNVTFKGLVVSCPSSPGAAAFYIDGKDFPGISNVTCDGCDLTHLVVGALFTAPAPGGSYSFLCNFPGHYAAGMHGMMTVVP